MCLSLRTGCLCWFSCVFAGTPHYFSFVVNDNRRSKLNNPPLWSPQFFNYQFMSLAEIKTWAIALVLAFVQLEILVQV